MFVRKSVASSCAIINRSMSTIRELAFINGKWVSAKSNETFPVFNPADGKKIGDVPDMHAVDTQDSIDAAHEAFKLYRKTTAKERSDLLRSWYNLLVRIFRNIFLKQTRIRTF